MKKTRIAVYLDLLRWFYEWVISVLVLAFYNPQKICQDLSEGTKKRLTKFKPFKRQFSKPLVVGSNHTSPAI